MPSGVSGRTPLDLTDHRRDVTREGPAVGIAEHEAVGARRLGRPQRAERVVGIPLEPVEEVLGVVDDLLEMLEEVRTESAIIARFSSSVVPSADVT